MPVRTWIVIIAIAVVGCVKPKLWASDETEKPAYSGYVPSEKSIKAACQACPCGDGVFGYADWLYWKNRQDGLDFHYFMIDNSWAGEADAMRYDLLEPHLQRYGNTAIVSYTFMLTTAKDGAITHRTHNESRVLVQFEDGWKVVHVHKSPAKPAVEHRPS